MLRGENKMQLKPRKPKQCKVCQSEFIPYRAGEVVCCVKCAMSYVNQQKQRKAEAEQRMKLKARKLAIQPLRYFAQKAQTEFNAYIRERDADQTCISCGRHHQGQYHAGHYRTVGANPELRFDEDNCHKQCSPCNNHLSGNIANYTPNLIAKIGQQRFDKLMGYHEPKKYSRQDYEAIRDIYRDKRKQLKQQAA